MLARGLTTAQDLERTNLALTVRPVLPLVCLDNGGTLKSWGQFHGSIPGSHLPLSTLHQAPRGRFGA